MSGLGALALVVGITAQVFLPGKVHAATQEFSGTRSLTLEDDKVGGSAPGSGTAGATNDTVKHLFSFTIDNLGSNVGSVSFQYCTTAEPVAGGIGCIQPTGMDLTNAALASNTGITGFTTLTLSTNVDASDTGATNNEIVVGRTSAASVVTTASTFEFSGVANPSTANTTFFVRIAVYSSTDGTGTPLEGGTVAASTSSPIQLSGNMPESLVFCTGGTVSETNSVPDCTTATSGSLSFNQLFSPTSTAYSTSQMAASTNAGHGYAITVGGTTLTSGTNSVKAMTTAGNSEYGVSQFGMNLVANDGTAYTNAPKIDATTMPAGYAPSADITPTSNGTNYNGEALANFNTNGTFAFNDTALNTVADSGYNTSPDTPIGTDSQIYTVSYIVNVPGSQPAGTYSTTLTYICTPTF